MNLLKKIGEADKLIKTNKVAEFAVNYSIFVSSWLCFAVGIIIGYFIWG